MFVYVFFVAFRKVTLLQLVYLQMENLNEQIIELVRANPCIYEKRDQKYKDCKYKEKVWENIGKELNLSAKECKIKWKSLRDRYRREKHADDLPSGSANKIGVPWKYYNSLEFLSESMESASTTSNFCEELDGSIEWLNEDSQSTSLKSGTKKRKNDDIFFDVLMAMKKKYEQPQTSTAVKYENFFGMLKEKFDRMSEIEVDDAQLEILQLLNRKINAKHL